MLCLTAVSLGHCVGGSTRVQRAVWFCVDALPSLFNVEFHYRMNFPHSVVGHVLATVVLLFRCMAYVPHRFPNNCNDRRFTEFQRLRSGSMKRKPRGSPTENGCAN